MQKHASQVLIHQKRASQVLIYQKTVQKRATTCKNVQKRASQIFLDPIQKRAPARSVQLEAVYLEALLYFVLNALCSKAKQLRIVLRHGIRRDFLQIHLL